MEVETGTPIGPVGTSWASSAGTRRSMQANRHRDTQPERALRSAVHHLGLRFRVAVPPIKGSRRSADLVFPRLRIAVFLDGCFWHGCPLHFMQPKANKEFWEAKIQGNRQRDIETDRMLEQAGWTVIRIWEHEPPVVAAARVADIVAAAKLTASPRGGSD